MQPNPAGSWRETLLRRSLRSIVLVGLAGPALAQAPVALFTTDPNPAEGGAPLTIQFLDQSTGSISSWIWDFGDGTGSAEQSPAHVFTLEQAFDVTLTVTGPDGSDSFTLLHAVDVLPTTNGVAGAPPALGTLVVPVPDDLGAFVVDQASAVRLGKALFWDMQLGSDGMTACASCHYHAGADNRVRNTLHPGADGVFDLLGSGRGGPNHTLSSGDFPFRKFVDANNGEGLIRDTDDRRGATGVLKKTFKGTAPENQFDFGESEPDGTFQVGGANTLRVTGRDAPTAIGAVFFHRLFWDGRANHFFNGRNIWGNSDTSGPTVLELLPGGGLGEVAILLEDAAAASQAVGPPLSDVEMSWAGRSWNDLGRKMVNRRPLASQHVDLSDGVLGELADPAGPGLRADITYADMIREAFAPRWWGSSELSDGFTHMEANFSLFFGLAIQAYESTLVPDQAPYDRWAEGDLTALNASERRGLDLFVGSGGCINCHGTPLFAGALRDEIRSPDAVGEGALELMPMGAPLVSGGTSFEISAGGTRRPDGRAVGFYGPGGLLLAWTRLPANLLCAPAGTQVFPLRPTLHVPPEYEFAAELRATTDGACGLKFDFRYSWNPIGHVSGTFQLRIGTLRHGLPVESSLVAVYDNGFYNIGVRPTSDDLGVGANGPFGPLSITRRVQAGQDVGHSPGVLSVPWFQRTAVDGAFKTPTLRNVELTGPYMHNGSMASLEQVVEFYARGADFGTENARDLDPDVSGIQALTEGHKADLVAFLKALTDPRVRHEQAPFDHPALVLKEGQVGDHQSVFTDDAGNAVPRLVHKPATGLAGGDELLAFDRRLPASVTVGVIEQGSTGARIGVVCDKKPAANVTVFFVSSNPALATLAPVSVTFTPENWRVGKEVVVTTLDPGSAGGSSLTVHTSRVQSSDPDFSGLPVADLVLDFVPSPLTNTDAPGRTAAAPAPGGAGVVVRKP